MLQELEHLFRQIPWWWMYLLTVLYFLFLYFGFALLAEFLTRILLPKYGIRNSINEKRADAEQKLREVRYSLVSIVVFGFFGVLPQAVYRAGWVNIEWTITWKLPLELIAVFLWNEVHFYCCHWLLHRKWFLKRVHYIHHQSFIPSPYSTYSFHWFEAFLLSTVMIIPMLFYDFNFISLLFLPFMSLFINTLGHWNYELFSVKRPAEIGAFSTRHSLHHARSRGNYGFLLPFMDKWFRTGLNQRE